MNIEKKVIEVYEMTETGINLQNNHVIDRVAIIHFVNGKFEECRYELSAHKYTYDDWVFLKAVAEKIIELHGEKK